MPQSPCSQHQDQRRNAPVISLFTEGRAAGTILLWIPFFMNLLMLYFVVFWLPALLRQTGKPVSAGMTAVMLFSVGGIAGIFRRGSFDESVGRVLDLAGGIPLHHGVLIALRWPIRTSFPLMMAITLVLGFAVQGAQGGLSAVAADVLPDLDPVHGNPAGALGIGRIGSIVGPMLGGMMLEARLEPARNFSCRIDSRSCAPAAATFTSLRLRDEFLPAEHKEAGSSSRNRSLIALI